MAKLLLLRSLAIAALAVTAQAEFKVIQFLPDQEDCNISLTTSVPVLCKGNINPQQKYDVWKTSLEFQFGIISREQWEALRNQYVGPWAGPAILSGKTVLFKPFNATYKYSLVDFLPLTIRGLIGHNFEEEDEALPAGLPLPPVPPRAPRLFNKTILVPNCWTTVYETLRTIEQCRKDDVDIFHDVYSTDDKDAQSWLDKATAIVPGNYTNTERRFGDIMFIYLKGFEMKRPILEHAVIFVDQDVVFEKAGTGNKNPYRLTDIATVEKEWKPTSQGGMFTWELRRPLIDRGHVKPFDDQFSLLQMQRDPHWPQFWQWPKELQSKYTLGRSDNPRNPQDPIDLLTLMKARRYIFQRSGGSWVPHRLQPFSKTWYNLLRPLPAGGLARQYV